MSVSRDAAIDGDQRHQVQECLERVESSVQAQREALERALHLTGIALGLPQGPVDASSAAAPPAYDNERRCWFQAARLRTLQHIERLYTVVALNNGAWNPAAFASLRDCPMSEAAATLAAAGRLSSLPILLQRHPRVLAPAALKVLAAIPETIEPKQYEQLLRQLAGLQQPPPLERAADWVETADTAAELREHLEYGLLLATEPIAAASSEWSPPTADQLAAWLCERAQHLDAATGQLSYAITLLEAGQAALHFGESGISSLLGLAHDLLALIKLASVREEGGATWRTDLRQYAALAPQQRLRLLLSLLGSGDSLASDLSMHVAPFLDRLRSRNNSSNNSGSSGSSDAVDAQVVLRQALEQEAAQRLSWVVRLVQCESRQLAAFSSSAQLAKTAGACCYACTASDAWELMSSMLKAAGEAVKADDELEPEERQAAEDGLYSVKGHVTAARLLTKHGLTTSVSTVRDADRSSALRLLRTLLARVSRSKNTESRWVDVWMDLRTIQQHGLTQLPEEDVRIEFCRALLRVGQYRLCKSYLQGLPQEAAEQLVLAAAKELFLSASSADDKAVKQATECLSLLPGSTAVQEQLASIAAAGKLQKFGLDLAPLQLQQLREQAATGGAKVLAQLVSEHPQLAAADSGTLAQVGAALGLAPQQQLPLLLRAAEAAHMSGDVVRAQRLLLLLAEQHHKPAWRLAAAVALAPGCNSATCQRLLVFAIASAPAEELFALLDQWKAADDSSNSSSSSSCRGGWELLPAAQLASDSAGAAGFWQQQQLWLAKQLQHCLLCGSDGSRSGSFGAEACALGCVMALDREGLALLERLVAEPQQPQLSHEQRRRALLLGFTSAALQALQPAEFDAAAAPAAAAAAEARLAASPAELLRLLTQQQAQQQAGVSLRSASMAAVEEELSQAPSDAEASESGDARSSVSGNTPPLVPARSAAASATAAAAMAAATRFRGLLLSAAAAQQLQQLLPGVDAAGALAGDSAMRRRLVLQLAAAAGTPPALRGSGSISSRSGASRAFVAARPCQPSAAGRLSSSDSAASSPRPPAEDAMQRSVSRKKSEAWGSHGDQAVGGASGTAAAAAAAVAAADEAGPASASHSTSRSLSGGGWAQRQLNAGAAAEMLGQALQLAAQCEVEAWEVHLAFVEALLLHSQQLWQQERQAWAGVQQLLEASLAVLLAEPQAAAALLGVLLRGVWRSATGRCPRHLSLCLHLAQRATAALSGPAAGGGAAHSWQQHAAAIAACVKTAEQLQQAAEGIDAKPFLQPVVQQLVAALPAAPSSSSVQEPAAVDPAVLNQLLLEHVSGSNVAALAASVAVLEQQQRLLEGPGYPCSSSTVYLAGFCRSIAQQRGSQGSLTAAAVGQSIECLQHMSPMHVATAAAFAARKAPCPLALPPSSEQLVAAKLSDEQRLQLLAAALLELERSDGSSAVPPELQLQQLTAQLRQQHALLAAYGALAAACQGASAAQVTAAREAADALQQAGAARAAESPEGLGGSSGTADAVDEGMIDGRLDSCLQQLLTTGCPATAVLRAAAVLQALAQHPRQAPNEAVVLLGRQEAAAAQRAVAAAASAAMAAALAAMSGQSSAEAEQQVSPGDAVQNLFALLRSLHTSEPAFSATSQGRSEGISLDSSSSSVAAAVEAEALAALRLLVWQQLQQQAAAYDGSGGAAASEAHVQVLELLGSVGSSGMWPGWQPPELPLQGPSAAASEGGGAALSHRQVLLFTRTAAALAIEWPAAVQGCHLSAADFASVEAAEGALLRLSAAAESTEQLRLLLRLLAEVLFSAFPSAAEGEGAAANADSPSAARQDEVDCAGELGSGMALVPLHRVWSSCLRMLLPLGDLPGVLAALDGHRGQQLQQRREGQRQPPPALLSEGEAASLLEAADATHGAAAAASLALLLPYPRLQRERWQLLLQACQAASSAAADLSATLPALSALLLLVVQQQAGMLVELASSSGESRQQQHEPLFKLLVGAALQQQLLEPGYAVPVGSNGLTLRTAVAASAASQLVAARQYTAAGWLAMHACGTPCLLRVLDSSHRVLQQLLRSCASDGKSAAHNGAASGANASGLLVAAAALLQQLPGQCSEAAAQLSADLQL